MKIDMNNARYLFAVSILGTLVLEDLLTVKVSRLICLFLFLGMFILEANDLGLLNLKKYLKERKEKREGK